MRSFFGIHFLISFCLVAQEANIAKEPDASIPSHNLGNQAIDNCLSEKSDFDLSQKYSTSGADDQGEFGTCGGYAGVNALELAWWRFNQSYQLKSAKPLEKTELLPFLTEPVFLAIKNELYKRHSGTLSMEILNEDNQITEGTNLERFTVILVDLLQKGEIKLYKQGLQQVSACHKISKELIREIDSHIQLAASTPKGKSLLDAFREERLMNHADDFLDIKTKNGKTLRDTIHKSFAKSIDDSTKGEKALNIRQDYFNQIAPFRLQIPQTENQKCDPVKLKNSFMRLLCGGVPIAVATHVYFQDNVLKVGIGTEQEESSHAMIVTGFKAAKPNSPFKFILKNSHSNQQSLEISPEDLCPALIETSILLNTGFKAFDLTSDFMHLPAGSPYIYPLERGYYKDGFLEWTEELNPHREAPTKSKIKKLKQH